MLMRKIVLMLALGLICGSAMAEWTWASGGQNGDLSVYVNFSSIRKNGNKVKMWALYDYKTIKNTGPKSYLSSTAQSEYDCSEETSGNIAVVDYESNMGNGLVVYSTNLNYESTPIAPDSVGEVLFKIACDKDQANQ
jgi:hypothetical protein